MKKHWTGLEILESNLVFLVDLDEKEYKQIGIIQNDEEEDLKPFIEKYREQLEQGRWLFTANKLEDGKYEASHRLSHAEWMIEENPEEEYPFYWDIAENDECVLFSHVVNGVGYSEGDEIIDPITPKEMDIT